MRSILTVSLILGLVACGGSTPGGGGDAGMDGGNNCPDRDNDNLCDADEATHGTNPDVADSDNDGILDGDEVEIGTNPTNPDTDGDGIPDGDELQLGTNPKVPDRGCASLDLGATLSQKPVDIVLVIDNSGSMGEEIKGVQDQINVNFADILEDSGLDFQLILLSYYGDVDEQGDSDPTHFCNNGGDDVNLDPHECEICIGPPLATGAVCPPDSAGDRPSNNARFNHYTVTINSRDSLERIIDSYSMGDTMTQRSQDLSANPWVTEANGTTPWVSLFPNGWSRLLRKGAQRVFLEMSDDDQDGGNMDADEFRAALAGLASPPQLDGEAPFGTLAEPNYVFHSIIGIPDNTPATAPYLPTDPIVMNGMCGPGGVRPGVVYQEVSVDTGGLRFPICNPSGYASIFNTIATRVVEGAEIECDFPVPAAPPGEQLDFSKIFLVYIPGNGGTNQQIRPVADMSQCAAGKFFTTGGGENTIIHLCPETCTPIRADNMAEIKVNVACTLIIP